MHNIPYDKDVFTLTRARSRLSNKQTMKMNKQQKIDNILAKAIQLRYEIMGCGFSMDEELSEDLQRSFEDVSLAILDLQVEIEMSKE